MKYTEYMPRRATIHSAGYDFLLPEDVEIKPKVWTTIDLGVKIEDKDIVLGGQPEKAIEDWVMFLMPRSSLARDYGFRLKNTVGVIDADFRGSIQIDVTVDKPLSLNKGEKICQGIITPFYRFEGEIQPVTVRGEGGFGSTDVKPEPEVAESPVPEIIEDKPDSEE